MHYQLLAGLHTCCVKACAEHRVLPNGSVPDNRLWLAIADRNTPIYEQRLSFQQQFSPPCSEERRCSKAQVHHWLSCQAEHAAGERALVLYQSKQTPTRLKEREQGSHCSSYLLDHKRKGELLAPDPQDHRTQDITGCLWEGF